MSNRVEELESKVAELQAAVNGLTEELVETKERLRQLEDANDVQVPSRAAQRRFEETPEEAESPDSQPEGDETKTDETEGADNDGEESLGDDIIVA
ncbi:chromosome segregation protein SMC [Haloferax namakaokahaiae]|uniref:Chromosome segregation protein SMC n=1 Tax=Haloferax namakaokahaiae TaxID=1748331 RepID=A0ABD5ZGY8_9EURY